MSVDLPQPDGADRTMNSGFVFMKHDYTILGAPLPKQRLDFSVNSPVSTRHLRARPRPAGGNGILQFLFLRVRDARGYTALSPADRPRDRRRVR